MAYAASAAQSVNSFAMVNSKPLFDKKTMFPSLMQQRPLMISSIIEFAERWHPDVEVVSRTTEGPIHRYTYSEMGARTRQLAASLSTLGIEQGDRVATLCLLYTSPSPRDRG